MQRFRQLIAQSSRDGSPGASPTEIELDAIAAALGATDLGEIIDALDELSREKDRLPDWDGDSQDDVARAQEVFTAILLRMAPNHGAAIAARLPGVEPLTRRYLDLALGRA